MDHKFEVGDLVTTITHAKTKIEYADHIPFHTVREILIQKCYGGTQIFYDLSSHVITLDRKLDFRSKSREKSLEGYTINDASTKDQSINSQGHIRKTEPQLVEFDLDAMCAELDLEIEEGKNDAED